MDTIIQQAFTVEDIESSIHTYVELHGVGPWFVRGPFVPTAAQYRGRPSQPRLTLARAFSGDVMLELVQQHDDAPSVYREQVGRHGYGFHHWGRLTSTFDADVVRFAELGMPVAFSDVTPTGSRIAYVDTATRLPGMTELIESNDAQRRLYAGMEASARDWDGRAPIRTDESLAR